jgi:hypothetical protein
VSLEALKLGRNRLSRLPSGLFRHAKRLRTVELANNHLRQVGGLFSELGSLVHLDLCHNYLLSLGEGVFHNSPEIHTLLLGKRERARIIVNICSSLVLFLGSEKGKICLGVFFPLLEIFQIPIFIFTLS